MLVLSSFSPFGVVTADTNLEHEFIWSTFSFSFTCWMRLQARDIFARTGQKPKYYRTFSNLSG